MKAPLCASMFALACLILMQTPIIRGDPVEGSRLLEEAFRDYDKRIRPSFGGSPVNINVSLYIISISDVDPPSMTYTMTFYIRQIWNDPRLSFNSRRNIDTITLDGATSERIWTPDTYFVNELSSVSHTALVKNEFCRISQDGMVLFSRKVTVTAYSPMSLQLFPYDSHTLTLELESYGSQTKDLSYDWTKDVSASEKPIPGFSFEGIATKVSSKTTDTGSYSILTLMLKIRRNPLPYEVGLMFPTALLLGLCIGAIYLRKPFVGPVISIFSVSVVLILYAQILLNFDRNGGGNGSPFLTPLHLYMLMSACFGFLCLVLNLRMNAERVASADENEENAENKSRTESTSDCKLEEIKSDNAAASLPKSSEGTSEDKRSEDTRSIWKRMTKRLQGQCKTKGSKCLRLIRIFLWSVLIAANVVFLILFRCLQ